MLWLWYLSHVSLFTILNFKNNTEKQTKNDKTANILCNGFSDAYTMSVFILIRYA